MAGGTDAPARVKKTRKGKESAGASAPPAKKARREIPSRGTAAGEPSSSMRKTAPAVSGSSKEAALEPKAPSKAPTPEPKPNKEPVPESKPIRKSAAKPKPSKEPAVEQENHAEVSPEQMSGKVIKHRAPRPPEYDDVWLDVYLSGTEWEQLHDVYKYEWDFTHLDEALTSGELKDAPIVHLFGCTEPQLITASEDDKNGTIIPIPVIVAIVSTAPPPSVVGIKSVQRAEEEIIPMSELRMSWNPRLPNNATRRNAPKARVHVLTCSERRARLRNMLEAAVHKYDYVLPYIIRPGQDEDDATDTNVQVLVDNLEGRSNPVMLDFDYEMDEIDEFVEEQIEEQELDTAKHAETMRQAIRDAVHAQKLKNKAEKEARKARIDSMSSEFRESTASMKLHKFYPSNEEDKYPDVTNHKSKYINRYYGQADFVH